MKRLTYIAIILCTFIYIGCANRGIGPQGGPKDETPPHMVEELPMNGAVNAAPKQIEIYFDEYIQLDNVAENVLISPPQQRPPRVTAIGKRVEVEFDKRDIDLKQEGLSAANKVGLKDSTTYTIQFGSAICDYTEKNPIEDYTFSFSTGPVIDTMQIGGLMLNAEDLNPISGITVGIYTVQADNNHFLHDSTLSTIPFERIGKTDAEGYFSISNMKHGDFRLFGLGDVSRDYIYQPGEGLAMYDSIITPRCHRAMVQDTLWLDSIAETWIEGERHRDTLTIVDTVLNYEATIFEPHNLLLMYFQENKQRHYFSRVLREKQHFFTLYFAAPQDSLPIIHPISARIDSLNVDTTFTDWLPYTMVQTNPTNDTITVWLTDSMAIKQDTLAFEMHYWKSDSLYQLQPQLDTIRAVYRAPRISEKARAKMAEQNKRIAIEAKTNAKNSFEIYQPLTLSFTTPTKMYTQDSLHLYQVIDTIRTPLAFTFTPADSSYMRYLVYPATKANDTEDIWEASMNYAFEADSAAFVDIYGNTNDALKATFKIRSLDEYSTLRIRIEPWNEQAVIQILDEKDQVIRTMPATADGALFRHLAPKSYYMRMFIDKNGDGQWTTGDYLTHRQPEPVFYFSSKLTLRANWDFEETFRYLQIPIEEQKPQELIKDAGKAKK